MMWRKVIVGMMTAAILVSLPVAGKKALGHEDFDSWQGVRNYALTDSGEWTAYGVEPQAGDGMLTIENTRTGKKIDIPRGYKPQFMSNGNYAVAMIKPLYEQTRQAKIAKKGDHEMPKDSLAVIDLRSGKCRRVADVLSYKIGEKGGDWIAYAACDTSLIKPKELKDKKSGRPLVIENLATGTRKVLKWVKNYDFSENGKSLGLTIRKGETDTVTTNGVGVVLLPDTSFVMLDREKPFYGSIALTRDGRKIAYTASTDSAETGTRDAKIYLADLTRPLETPREVPMTFADARGALLRPNQHTKPAFSYDGRRLIGGVAPVIAPDDTTIVDFEQGKLDIWVWDVPMIPPRDKFLLDETLEKNYPVVVDLGTMNGVLTDSQPLAEVVAPWRWEGDWALVKDPTENYVSHQWDYFAPTAMSVVNVNTGERRDVGHYRLELEPELSPANKYVVWFDDRQWWGYEIATGTTRCLTDKIPYPVWDTEDEHPSPSQPYGLGGWEADDARLLVYDRHDVWRVDPRGEKAPECLTAGEGRARNLRFRVRQTNPDRDYFENGEEILLSVFDYTDKYNGLATVKSGKNAKPAVGELGEKSYTQIKKAKDASVYTYQSSNFSTSPNLWLSRGVKFINARRLTDTNPQMADYRWGTAHLERWNAYDGKPSEGVLYVPDDLDPNKKYPMICVFYEKGSEDLYSHYTMEPSWSWVNYPFYVSRGYVIFVPDIHYTSGRPGEDAYNYVCSGAEEMCRRYPWIDKEKIGIDGQSWGGYQTAYLVTRTDMFACAGSGAPVSNMTSAYGGIRWTGGDSRQAQYEQGQSRIGGTLWDMQEQYIANSPVFKADKVNTPLLIMHNDADGAVPWYQGIEYFMALRRLQKPVWMLQYNGEAHNLRERKNRKDLTRRFQQFFDHYLKGEPMPRWMKEGLPQVRKGQEWYFEND